MPPEGKPKPDKPLGAIVSFATVATPGMHQVTLSEEAWIDIVQDGTYRPSLEFSGVRGCPPDEEKWRPVFRSSRAICRIPITFIPSGQIGLKGS